MADPIEMSYQEALLKADIDDQKKVLLARKYHKGEQKIFLTDRQKEYLELNKEVDYRLNVCQVIVRAVLDELNVVGFDTTEKKNAEGKKALAEWAWNWWQTWRMDAMQNDVHEAALRDRESMVIVDWDPVNKIARPTFHERYISQEAGGTDYGTGVQVQYENDDIYQPMRSAAQYWIETIPEKGQLKTRRRRTVYYPERIERFYYDMGGWKEYQEEGKPWPQPWTKNGKAKGEPLGIPVIHFKNDGFSPEAWEAIPQQDVINKMALDLLAATDGAAFPLLVALGFYPTTDGKEQASDGSNKLKIAPMQIIGTAKSKNDADLKKIEGSDLAPMVDTLVQVITLAAHITSTPVSRFIMTKQVAGIETLKGQDEPLQRKAEKRRVLFGNGWEDVLSMARKLENAFGSPKNRLDEKYIFSTLWRHSQSIDELTQKQTLGVPDEQIWAEIGYDESKIEEMRTMQSYRLKQRLAMWEKLALISDDVIPLDVVLRDLQIMTDEELKALDLYGDRVPPSPQ